MFANLERRRRCSRAPMRLPSIWLGQRSPETCCSSCRMGASTDCAKSCCKSSALRDRFQARPKPGELYFRPETLDRKSTRLNSSHITISYAVFCLKKKKNNNTTHKDHSNIQ